MPAILVASKMKSGLPKPKPVHSALPIPQTHSRPSALALPVKTQVPPLGKQVGSGPPRSVTPGSEAGGNPQPERNSQAAGPSQRPHPHPPIFPAQPQRAQRHTETCWGWSRPEALWIYMVHSFRDSFLKPATSSLDSFFLCGFVFYASAPVWVQFDLDLVQMAYIEHRLPNQQSSSV
ncbi:hypothetical protein D5F01_LYC04330 [Larimichthys crocea]|uniref:Uncharacterized protein n=1 Tax=Larimichthys crocea TaxID=215358 RepID=A0A6G0J2J4_LARCR|nr:hypothetical protein D5F01_LYC04330 [Larimichthys crocea]